MTEYYLTFTLANGETFTADGSPLYKVSNFDFSTQQTLNIGSQSSGAGAGKITFNPLTFTLGSSQLTEKLDQLLASGTPLDQINLIGYDTGANGKPVKVSDDAFKFAAVKSDSTDIADGLHSFSFEYGGLVESVTPINAAGVPGNPVVAGWNSIKNIADSSLTSGIKNLPDVTLPPLDPHNAIPAPSTELGKVYARLLGNNGQVIGGGWIALTSASVGLEQTLNIGSKSSGAGAGKVTFNPLDLSFQPGTLEPLLLHMEADGKQIEQIDVAVYDGTGPNAALTTDYRFGVAAIASSDTNAVHAGTVDYTFKYGLEQIADYATGSSTPVVEGWNRVTNLPDTKFANVAPATLGAVQLHLADTGGGGGSPPACYAVGVRLRSERGEIAVEALKVGDCLMTLSGDFKPVIWIGRRRYFCGAHPNPERIWPVVIAAGAFGNGLPARDLLVSPGHALYFDGRLVQAIRLVNGATIRQAPVAEVEYWHVELDSHNIVYAEGLPAESYLDTGNRTNFEGGADIALHPDFGPKRWDETCVPYLDDGAPTAALRERLLRRVEDFGFTFEDDPDLHAFANGRRIEPVRLGKNRYVFVFPESVVEALIASRTWRPAESTPNNSDPRTLGVCLSRLDVDGTTLDLADEILSEGWGNYEPGERQRWTTGRARLPAGLRIAILDLCGVGRYLHHARLRALEA